MEFTSLQGGIYIGFTSVQGGIYMGFASPHHRHKWHAAVWGSAISRTLLTTRSSAQTHYACNPRPKINKVTTGIMHNTKKSSP